MLSLAISLVVVVLLYVAWCLMDLRLKELEKKVEELNKPYLSNDAIRDIRSLEKQGYSMNQISKMYNRSISEFVEELHRVRYYD